VHQGTTFRLAKVDDHLWVVLSDPARFPDKVVIASFTTEEYYEEKTCVVESNEHPWELTHRSCVAYEFARVRTLAELFQLRDKGLLQELQHNVSQALLQKIFACAPNSPGLKDNVAEVLEAQGYINLDD
jgi:hypothetical protein